MDKLIQFDPNTKLTIETVVSGFLGYKLIYCLWTGNKMVAYSLDKINWRMCTWLQNIKQV